MMGFRAKLGQREERERPLVGSGAGIGKGEGGGEVMLRFLRPLRSSELAKEAVGSDPRQGLVRLACGAQGLLRTAASAGDISQFVVVPRPGVAVAGAAKNAAVPGQPAVVGREPVPRSRHVALI